MSMERKLSINFLIIMAWILYVDHIKLSRKDMNFSIVGNCLPYSQHPIIVDNSKILEECLL